MLVLVCLVISDVYSFHLTVLLNSVFNSSNSLLSVSVDKVTTRAYHFVSVISKVVFVGAPIACLAGLPPYAGTGTCVVISTKTKTKFSDHVKIIFISQLINRI